MKLRFMFFYEPMDPILHLKPVCPEENEDSMCRDANEEFF